MTIKKQNKNNTEALSSIPNRAWFILSVFLSYVLAPHWFCWGLPAICWVLVWTCTGSSLYLLGLFDIREMLTFCHQGEKWYCSVFYLKVFFGFSIFLFQHSDHSPFLLSRFLHFWKLDEITKFASLCFTSSFSFEALSKQKLYFDVALIVLIITYGIILSGYKAIPVWPFGLSTWFGVVVHLPSYNLTEPDKRNRVHSIQNEAPWLIGEIFHFIH